MTHRVQHPRSHLLFGNSTLMTAVPTVISVFLTSLAFPSFTSTCFPTLGALGPESRHLALMPYSCSEMPFPCHYSAISLLNNSQNPTFVQFKVETYPPSNINPIFYTLPVVRYFLPCSMLLASVENLSK